MLSSRLWGNFYLGILLPVSCMRQVWSTAERNTDANQPRCTAARSCELSIGISWLGVQIQSWTDSQGDSMAKSPVRESVS